MYGEASIVDVPDASGNIDGGPSTRRGFLGGVTKASVVVVAAAAGLLRKSGEVVAHDDDCNLWWPHDPYCSYNCWRASGYNSVSWVSRSGHNWCFECTTGETCYDPDFLCSEWGHM